MSFANERVTCGAFTRPLLFSAYNFIRVNLIGLSKCILGDFFMEKKLKRIVFSGIMEDLSATRMIAYIAIMTALLVVCNMFFEIRFAQTQYSLTLFFSIFAGMVIGPFFGFAACFLGDLVGFLYNPGPYSYMPWIGLALGTAAFISGFIMNGIKDKNAGTKYIKISIVCVSTFLLCTIGINTTAFWILYGKGVPFFAYLVTRVFAMGQIINSIINYALLFICYPTMLTIIEQLRKRKRS